MSKKDEALKLARHVMHNQGDIGVDEWIATEKAIDEALAEQHEMTNIERHERNVQKFLVEQPAPVQGWKTVPVDPTVAMIDATGAVEADMREMVVANWKGMLAAAPHPAQCAPADDGVCEALDCPNHTAQQEPDDSDDLTIAYMAGVQRGKELAKQPTTEESSAVEKTAQQEPYGQVTVVRRPGCADQHWFYRWPNAPYLDNAAECHVLYTTQQPAQQQEPVATIDSLEQEIYENTREFVSRNVMEWMLKRYYTSPPAQRTWVGLTNNELQPIADEYRILFGSWVEDFARAIEAKLKERNT